MLQGNPIKRTEAMQLADDRANIKEVISFAEESDIVIPTAIGASGDLRTITRFLLTSKFPIGSAGIAYAVKPGGTQVSQEEAERISKRIKETLGGGEVK